MRVHPLLVPILFVVAFLGTVAVAQSAGLWSTSGRTSVTLSQLAPADVKGWMTLQQVAEGFGLSQAELYALVNLPADVPASTALKDVEKLAPGFEVSALREALEARMTAPAAPTDAPALPTPQPTDVSAALTPTPAPTDGVAPPTPTPASAGQNQPQNKAGGGNNAGAHVTPTPLPAGAVLPGSEIKGRMSLREISDLCAVPLDALLAALNLPAGANTDAPIRELVSQGQIPSLSAAQEAVTALQSK